MVFCPNGAQGDSPGQSEAPPWDWCARNNPSPERAEPAARQSMRTCSALSGLWRIGAAGYSARWRTTQGGAALYPGLSHYAPLGRTIRLRIGVDCTLQATQVVVGYSGLRLPDGFMPQRGGRIAGLFNEARWFYAPMGRRDRGFIERSPMVLCPNGAQGDSPGQSEAPPWDSVRKKISLALKGRNPTARKPMRYVPPFQGFGELGRRGTQRDGVRPRVALRSTLGYLIMPLWGERSGYGSVLIAHCRRPKLWWVIRDCVCPMVLCPNGAAGSRVH
jgi:hypothetical protein